MGAFINIRNRLWGNAQYKFSIIFCSLYTVIFFGNDVKPIILFYIFISILLSVGIAGIGYSFNDYQDYNDDLKNSKPNIFLYFNKAQSTFLILLFLALAIIPWFILPFDKISLSLLLSEIILFIIYTFPPFRLKERGAAGIFADALYAQVVPCILAVYTYSKIVSGTNLKTYHFIPFVIWLICSGCRNIINHQIDDFHNDSNSNTDTLITTIGIDKSKKWVSALLIPIELISFIVLLYNIPHSYHIFFFTYLIYFIIYVYVFYVKKENTLYNLFNLKLLNEFYEIHLPVILLIYFSLHNSFYIYILVINLIMFTPIYYSYIKGFFQKYLR